MRRRALLGAVAGCALPLAGCSGLAAPDTATTEGTTTERTPETDAGTTTWTATTDCDSMHENVIRIEWTTDDVRDAYSPIRFSSLPAEEQAILETVVVEGGFANCEVTDAFRGIVDRVMAHRRVQDEFLVYLEHDGIYYGLYVRQGDAVLSWG